jgi:hypothetical protein
MEPMTLITSKWMPGKGPVEIKRETVTPIKKGRWLAVGYDTYDPETLRRTRSSASGSGFIRRLERIQADTAC